MLIVLVGPPNRTKPGGCANKVPEAITPRVNAMDVVMSEPSSVGHGKATEEDADEGDGMGSREGADDEPSKDAQQLDFVNGVTLPPAISL